MINLRDSDRNLVHVEGFSKTGMSYAERTGPSDFEDAVGRIVIFRAEMRERLSNAIFRLSGWPHEKAPVVLPMTMDEAAKFLGSLVAVHDGPDAFNCGNIPATDLFSEIEYMVAEAERLSSAVLEGDARELDSGELLDVADFMCSTSMHLEEFLDLHRTAPAG